MRYNYTKHDPTRPRIGRAYTEHARRLNKKKRQERELLTKDTDLELVERGDV